LERRRVLFSSKVMAEAVLGDHHQRGWSMRKGHRARLAREHDKESQRGRARYSASVGVVRHHLAGSELWTSRKSSSSKAQQQSYLLKQGCEEFCYFEDFVPTEGEFLEEDCWEQELWESSEDSWSWASSPSSAKSDTCTTDEFSLQLGNKKATRWERAQKVADQAAAEYCEFVRTHPKPSTNKVSAAHPGVYVERKPVLEQIFSTRRKLADNRLRGRPRFQDLHDRALHFAGPEHWTCKKPSKSQTRRSRNQLGPAHAKGTLVEHLVHEESDEYKAVTDYFVRTLDKLPAQVTIGSLMRIQNPAVYSRFLECDGRTLMFHGCKTFTNERNILQNGFQVSCSRSYGPGFGTFLAYNARYSNGGFVYPGAGGWNHLFVCVASHYYTTLDDMVMRVVGQDCAYPQWLLRYKVES